MYIYTHTGFKHRQIQISTSTCLKSSNIHTNASHASNRPTAQSMTTKSICGRFMGCAWYKCVKAHDTKAFHADGALA